MARVWLWRIKIKLILKNKKIKKRKIINKMRSFNIKLGGTGPDDVLLGTYEDTFKHLIAVLNFVEIGFLKSTPIR